MPWGRHVTIVLSEPYGDACLGLRHGRPNAGNSDLARVIGSALNDYAVLIPVSYKKQKRDNESLSDFCTQVIMIPATGNSRNLLCADYEYSDLMRTHRVWAEDLILEGASDESCRICRHNAYILTHVFSGGCLIDSPLLTVGVWAPFWERRTPPGANGIVEFVSRYFDKHPDEFPLGNWREIVTLAGL